jgi:hypothetical protein
VPALERDRAVDLRGRPRTAHRRPHAGIPEQREQPVVVLGGDPLAAHPRDLDDRGRDGHRAQPTLDMAAVREIPSPCAGR